MDGANKLKKILIVDDDADVRHFMKEYFKVIGGYKVLVAKGGSMGQWLASCRWHKPDLILLDIMMPKMNGFSLLRILKRKPQTSSIPVIMVTGRRDVHARRKAYDLGCEDFLIKPLDLGVVKSKVEAALQKKTSG